MLKEFTKELTVVLLIGLVPLFLFIHYQRADEFLGLAQAFMPNIYFLGYVLLISIVALIPYLIKHFVYSSLQSFNTVILFFCDVFERASETIIGLLRGAVAIFIFFLLLQLFSDEFIMEPGATIFYFLAASAGIIDIIAMRHFITGFERKFGRKIT